MARRLQSLERWFRVQIFKCERGSEVAISIFAADRGEAIQKALCTVYPDFPFFHQEKVWVDMPTYFKAYGRVAKTPRTKRGGSKVTEYGDLIQVIVTDG